jgi:hypothetical protein
MQPTTKKSNFNIRRVNSQLKAGSFKVKTINKKLHDHKIDWKSIMKQGALANNERVKDPYVLL